MKPYIQTDFLALSDKEYLYAPEYQSSCWTGDPCFVCGGKLNEDAKVGGWVANFIAQCPEAAERVRVLFIKGANPFTYPNGKTEVRVFACSRHLLLLELLREFVAQSGIITLEKVRELQESRISKEVYRRLEEKEAYRLWQDRIKQRSDKNWCDAWEELSRELGHIPGLVQRMDRAEKLHDQRKGPQAEQDTLDAGRALLTIFSVID